VLPLANYDFNDLAVEYPNSNVLTMNNGIYDDALAFGDLPMDLGAFSEAFNWVRF